MKKAKILPTSDDAPCLPLQAFTRHRVLLACILGTAASVSAQGIIDTSDYISAPGPNVTKASTPVSSRTLHTVGKSLMLLSAAAPKVIIGPGCVNTLNLSLKGILMCRP